MGHSMKIESNCQLGIYKCVKNFRIPRNWLGSIVANHASMTFTKRTPFVILSVKKNYPVLFQNISSYTQSLSTKSYS